MAIELPSEVAQLLQFIGISWPLVNEDKVREFATHIDQFAANVESTHQDATATIQKAGGSYSGAAYQALVTKWADMSSTHMQDLLSACRVLADALNAAADYIVAMKLEAIAELVVLAASFIADQAAAIATFGLAEAGLALIEEAAEKAVEFLKQQLVQYIIAQVIEAALNPLIAVVAKAVDGLAYSAVASMLGTTGDSEAALGESFGVDPDELSTHAATMHVHAETMAGHVATFKANVAGASFT